MIHDCLVNYIVGWLWFSWVFLNMKQTLHNVAIKKSKSVRFYTKTDSVCRLNLGMSTIKMKYANSLLASHVCYTDPEVFLITKKRESNQTKKLLDKFGLTNCIAFQYQPKSTWTQRKWKSKYISIVILQISWIVTSKLFKKFTQNMKKTRYATL